MLFPWSGRACPPFSAGQTSFTIQKLMPCKSLPNSPTRELAWVSGHSSLGFCAQTSPISVYYLHDDVSVSPLTGPWAPQSRHHAFLMSAFRPYSTVYTVVVQNCILNKESKISKRPEIMIGTGPDPMPLEAGATPLLMGRKLLVPLLLSIRWVNTAIYEGLSMNQTRHLTAITLHNSHSDLWRSSSS